jgi:hypothetical protein
MIDYPFIVKGRVKKVCAPNYKNALDRVLYKNPNHFIQTKFAKRMDLITAENEAKAASKSKKGARYYVTVSEHGELDYSSTLKRGDTVNSVFVDGKRGTLTPEELDTDSLPADKNLANKPIAKAHGKAVLTPEDKAKHVEKTRAGVAKILESNKSLNKIIETGMKNAEKNKAKNNVVTKAAPVKTIKPAVAKEAKVKTVPRGNNMYLTEAEWKKVDALLAKEGVSFSAWSRGLVQAKIK